MERKVKIFGTGTYLPKNRVTAGELARKIGAAEEWVVKKSGVQTRYFVEDETTSYMGAQAARRALENAGLKLEDISAIVSAGGVMQQSIPCTAALIQRELGMEGRGIPGFDVNATCLGFVAALDLLSTSIQEGRYGNVMIICSDIASVGLDWGHHESCTLFGDGAAAVIIGPTPVSESAKICSTLFETYCEGVDDCRIQGGGTRLHPRDHSDGIDRRFLFEMNGREVFRKASMRIVPFVTKLLGGLDLDDISLLIPHQASAMALRIIRQKLGIEENKMVNVISEYGNMIAASIPLALHEAIQAGKLKRGDRCLLLGTSAGLSIGGVVLEY